MTLPKPTDKLAEILLKRAHKLYPDLINHEIIESWFDGESSFIIKSTMTDSNGTQIYLTRLSF